MSHQLKSIAPIERVNLKELAYQGLRQGLQRGVYAPGTKFTVRGVAEALGTSPMPARSALERLTAEGALVPHVTNRVLEIPPLSWELYRELMSIRIALEDLAARNAAQAITAQELAVVETHLARLEAAAVANDIAGYVDANFEFHFGIYRAARQKRLLSLIEQIWTQIGSYVGWMMGSHEALTASVPTHQNIYRALAAGDAGGAASAICDDISTSGRTLLERLEADAKQEKAG